VLLLTSTSDKLQVVTSAAVTTDVHASWVDYSAGTITPGRTNSAIATATTNDVVAAPAASTQRNIKHLSVRNKHASTSQDVTVKHTDGTTVVELFKCTLAAGEELVFNDGTGFMVFTAVGALKTADQGNSSQGYTPVWTADGTQPSLGNGSLTGRHVTQGDMVTFSITFAAGSTTTFGTSNYHFSLPVNATAGEKWLANCAVLDTGLQYYTGFATIEGDVSAGIIQDMLISSNTVGPTNWGATNPFTFGSGDKAIISGSYRKA
jgi:hypothetical protein